MTRIIIAATPIYGHVEPLRPIAADLVRRGEQVTFLTGSGFRASVEETGARFAALPGEADYDIAEFLARHPERTELEPGPPAISWDLINLFIKPIPLQHEALQHLLQEADGEPVVVLAETSFHGAKPMVLGAGIRPAGLIGIGVTPLPLSSVDTAPFGLGLPPDASPEGRARNIEANRAVRQAFSEVQRYAVDVMRTLGATEDLPFFFDAGVTVPDLYLQLSIEGLEYPRSDAPASLRFVGALPEDASARPAPLPGWWPEVQAAQRVVVVTQGTVANGDFTELVEPTLDALADLDVLVVAVLGRGGTLPRVPADARVAEFIPFADLLPHTNVLVSNGGYGGVQRALRHGVPMVLAGQTEDKIEVTARTAWTGAAINLATQRPATTDIRAAVESVLDTPTYKERALQLSAHYAKHDTFAEIHAAIGEMIARHGA
ncbi:nucleotide disphospho-sugar-binding domain-containing protein [Amycolatopsis sp. GM8]|uniref:nucleotide disphospho-sugar-binding domain-containing protein n=1 Tax=Amycolatopsis sp. GM8 TaxID=2896530 RepID=UPI001F40C4D1|nr:nucleotide disphospho-sugar-binding domain-containing protein [Amycolatopsis sp. GM8]